MGEEEKKKKKKFGARVASGDSRVRGSRVFEMRRGPPPTRRDGTSEAISLICLSLSGTAWKENAREARESSANVGGDARFKTFPAFFNAPSGFLVDAQLQFLQRLTLPSTCRSWLSILISRASCTMHRPRQRSPRRIILLRVREPPRALSSLHRGFSILTPPGSPISSLLTRLDPTGTGSPSVCLCLCVQAGDRTSEFRHGRIRFGSLRLSGTRLPPFPHSFATLSSAAKRKMPSARHLRGNVRDCAIIIFTEVRYSCDTFLRGHFLSGNETVAEV